MSIHLIKIIKHLAAINYICIPEQSGILFKKSKTKMTIMKNSILSLSIVFLFLVTIVFAGCSSKAEQGKTEGKETSFKETSFKVYGNCEMCKKTIEGSLKGVDGVSSANWDVEKKIIAISYDPAKIKETDLHKKVAGVGYDTELEKGSDEAYNNLPGCCQYERKK